MEIFENLAKKNICIPPIILLKNSVFSAKIKRPFFLIGCVHRSISKRMDGLQTHTQNNSRKNISNWNQEIDYNKTTKKFAESNLIRVVHG